MGGQRKAAIQLYRIGVQLQGRDIQPSVRHTLANKVDLGTRAEKGVEIFGHQRAQVAVHLTAEADGLVGPFCVPNAGQGNLPAHPVHPVSGQFQFRDEIMNRPGPLHGQVQCGRAGHVQQA